MWTQLAEGYLPEQIAGHLRRAYPYDMGKHLSSGSIYAGLYVWPGQPEEHTVGGATLGAQGASASARGADRRGQIPTMTRMAERPAEVVARTVPGRWEGDLIKGARNGSAVGTLVERTTCLVILAKMEGTDARSARAGFTKKLRHVPAPLRNTLTDDRGERDGRT